MGCRQALLPTRHEPLSLEAFCQGTPLHRSQFFALHHLPDPDLGPEIGRQADSVVRAVTDWLGHTHPIPSTRMVILDPREQAAQEWLRRHPLASDHAGGTVTGSNTLLVIGDGADERFWTVLRHEAAHYALRCVSKPGVELPFWLDEGVACLFESGLDVDNRPNPNPDRQALLRYLAKTRSGPHLKRLLGLKMPSVISGHSYARAWGITAYLYARGKSPRRYLDALGPHRVGWLALFESTLLDPMETMEQFDRAVLEWIALP